MANLFVLSIIAFKVLITMLRLQKRSFYLLTGRGIPQSVAHHNNKTNHPRLIWGQNSSKNFQSENIGSAE